jgi:pimeloyl-ACP methyl ester carboxylesterase
MRALVPGAWVNPPGPDEVEWLVGQSTKTPEYAARLLATDAMARDATTLAETVDGRLPILHIVGEANADAARRWLARHAPSARLEALGRHLMFWEFPDRFNAIVDGFLADNDL